jgi:hypothetical protein
VINDCLYVYALIGAPKSFKEKRTRSADIAYVKGLLSRNGEISIKSLWAPATFVNKTDYAG